MFVSFELMTVTHCTCFVGNAGGYSGGGSHASGHTGTGSGLGSDVASGQHGHHGHQGTGSGHNTSSSTKGAQYDATGGAVDDRSFLQKGKDALKPGDQVGTHSG